MTARAVNTTLDSPSIEPRFPRNAKNPARARPLVLVLWAIVTVALLGEYILTTLDLQKANASRHALAHSLDNPEAEFDEGTDPENRSPVDESEIEALRAERDALRTELDELSLLQGKASSSHPRTHSDVAEAGPESPSRTLRQDPSLPRRGRILSTQGSRYAAIDLGSRDGLREGMVLRVFARGAPVGTLKLTQVRDRVSGGRVTLEGGGSPNEGLEVGEER